MTKHPFDLNYEYSAQIPQSIYWCLYEAGVLPDPYKGINSKQYHWVDEKVWYFRKRFTAQPAGRRALLCFDGLAYYSRVMAQRQMAGRA